MRCLCSGVSFSAASFSSCGCKIRSLICSIPQPTQQPHIDVMHMDLEDQRLIWMIFDSQAQMLLGVLGRQLLAICNLSAERRIPSNVVDEPFQRWPTQSSITANILPQMTSDS